MAAAPNTTTSGILGNLTRTNIDPRNNQPYQSLAQRFQQVRASGQSTDNPLYEVWQMGLLPDGPPSYQGLPLGNSVASRNNILGHYDTSSIDALKARANAVGKSPWASMQEEALGSQGAKQAMQGVMGARSQLAQKGGLSRGASERLATAGARNATDARLGAAQQATMQDEQQKLDIMKALPGLESQEAQTRLAIDSPWLQMQGQNAQLQNAFNADLFKTKMGAYGAAKNSQAIANSASPDRPLWQKILDPGNFFG